MKKCKIILTQNLISFGTIMLILAFPCMVIAAQYNAEGSSDRAVEIAKQSRDRVGSPV